jgi:hypothetical protein
MVQYIVFVFDSRWFKYNSSLDTNNDAIRTSYSDDNFGFRHCVAGNSSPKEDQTRGRPFFSKHYRMHSRQLVNALQNWESQLVFTSYEYKEGLFTPEKIEPEYIPFIQQMKKHLDKSYQGLLPSPLEIETNHKNLCNKIQNLMEYKSDVIPSRPSFEKIIIDRINNLCPTLNISDDEELRGNNIYGDKFIFYKIFDYVSRGKSTMNLNIKPDIGNKMLWYEGTKGFARGTQETMEKLKGAIQGLLQDEEIISRINEYNNLINQLKNDEQIKHMKSVIREFCTLIYGGRTLGGYPCCDLCDPDIPVDMS